MWFGSLEDGLRFTRLRGLGPPRQGPRLREMQWSWKDRMVHRQQQREPEIVEYRTVRKGPTVDREIFEK